MKYLRLVVGGDIRQIDRGTGGDELKLAQTAATVRVPWCTVLITDGPFAETKEHAGSRTSHAAALGVAFLRKPEADSIDSVDDWSQVGRPRAPVRREPNWIRLDVRRVRIADRMLHLAGRVRFRVEDRHEIRAVFG